MLYRYIYIYIYICNIYIYIYIFIYLFIYRWVFRFDRERCYLTMSRSLPNGKRAPCARASPVDSDVSLLSLLLTATL